MATFPKRQRFRTANGGTAASEDDTRPLESAESRVADAWHDAYRSEGETGKSEDESLEFLRRLFEEAPAPYIVTDAKLLILKANAAAQQLLNRPLRDLTGKPLSVTVAPSDLRAFRRSIKVAVMSGLGPINRPLRVRPGGALPEREVFVSASILLGKEGTADYVCWLLHDPDQSRGGDIL